MLQLLCALAFQLTGELPHCIDHPLSTILNFDHDRAGLIGQVQALLSLHTAAGHTLYGHLSQGLVLLHHIDNFFRRLAGAGGQTSNLVGYHSKATTLLTGASSFNGRIEGQ